MAATCVLAAAVAEAREPHRPRPPREKRPKRPPRTSEPTPPKPPAPPAPDANVHFVEEAAIPLPGRGLALAWSPDGTRIATGGRFRDKTTGLRYDTRIADVASRTLVKSFACHHFFVVATAWSDNPFLGEVIADGAGDHAVKLWRAAAPGSTTCKPGQLSVPDGGIRQLGEVNGWVTSLAFSPDGRFLAGASRDRMVRIWQLAPGPHQFRVVGVLFDPLAGNFGAVAWRPDGRGLVTGDRKGRVTAWDYDPDVDGFDDATVATFAKLSYEAHPGWCMRNKAIVTRAPLWQDARKGWIWNVRVAPDGTRVAAAGADGVVAIYDLDAGAVLLRSEPTRQLHALDWSPDGTLLATGGDDHVVTLLDAATGAAYDRLEGHADDVSAVAWSPDGSRLASTAGGMRVSQTLLNSTTGPDLAIRLWVRR